jgi:hypothetical protein
MGTGVFSGVNCSFGTSTGPAKVAPQFLQNLSSGFIFWPHFGQKFAIILISFKMFNQPLLYSNLNRDFRQTKFYEKINNDFSRQDLWKSKN